MKKKIVFGVLSVLCGLSLLSNMYFISKDIESVLKIDNNVILTNKELNEKLKESYRLNVINNILDKELLELAKKKSNIKSPTDDDLAQILVKFPSASKYAESVTDLNREHLKNVYYIYNMYLTNEDKSIEDIKLSLKRDFGISEFSEYVVKFYETDSHHKATQIENALRANKSIQEVEDEYGVKFDVTTSNSMESLLGEDYVKSMNVETIDDKFNVGEVFHISSDGKMVVMQIENIQSFETDDDRIRDIYFSKNYDLVKSNLINKLRGLHTIEY